MAMKTVKKQKRRKARGANGGATITGAQAHRVDVKFTKHDLGIVSAAVAFQAEVVEGMLRNGDVADADRNENLDHLKALRRIGIDLLGAR